MDYLAGALEVLGMLLIGNFCRSGFLICLGCNALLIIVACQSGVHGLIPVSLAMACVNTRNYLHWKHHRAME